MLRSLVDRCLTFGEKCCIRPQDIKLKIEVGRSAETLISVYQNTWRHFLEQNNIQYYGRLKTVKVLTTYISTKAWFHAKQIRGWHTDFLREWKLHWNSVHLTKNTLKFCNGIQVFNHGRGQGGGLLEEDLLPELLECCARLLDHKLATDRGVYLLQWR